MQESDEQSGNRGLLKAELENVFGKPQPKVAGSHRKVVGKNDVADLHRTYCLSLSTAVIFYDLYTRKRKRRLN